MMIISEIFVYILSLSVKINYRLSISLWGSKLKQSAGDQILIFFPLYQHVILVVYENKLAQIFRYYSHTNYVMTLLTYIVLTCSLSHVQYTVHDKFLPREKNKK